MTELEEARAELRAVARDVLGKTTGIDARRLGELGWSGLEVAESLGGAGASFAETAVLLEELGRTAAAGPFLGGVLGVGALIAVVPGAARDGLLSAVAAGRLTVALALDADGGTEPLFRLRSGGAGPDVSVVGTVSGCAPFVPDAAAADRLLLPALDPTGVPVLAAVDRTALTCTDQPVLDLTRRFASVSADGATPTSVWRFAGDPHAALRGLRDRAAVAVALDSLGSAEAMLAATVAYAGVREQFGRPIGSFQAVKHACADMLVQVALARALVAAAVDAVGSGEGPSVAASMAKAYACGTAVDVVGKAVQLHGGIGYTWESGIHVHLKRVAVNRSLFGSPAVHRARLAERYG